MSSQVRAYARDDGKVIVEIWVDEKKQVSYEQSPDDAESTGRGLIEKAAAARSLADGCTVHVLTNDGTIDLEPPCSQCSMPEPAEWCWQQSSSCPFGKPPRSKP